MDEITLKEGQNLLDDIRKEERILEYLQNGENALKRLKDFFNNCQNLVSETKKEEIAEFVMGQIMEQTEIRLKELRNQFESL